MKFPSEALAVLLKFARGKTELNAEVVEAGLDVLKYIYNLIMSGGKEEISGAVHASDEEVAELIEQMLDENSSGVMAFGPTIWVTIGLWILEVVLKKVLK